ncbi:MAG: glycerate kinase [Anaerolineales bacterium]|nr:glycerate kinase [Anaerolineales bacterium]
MKKINPASLKTHSFGHKIGQILSTALRAVEPGQAIRRFVYLEGALLHIAEKTYGLDSLERVTVLGLGKATQAMAESLLDILPPHIPTRGLLIPKQAFPSSEAGFEVCAGGHPVPNQNSLIAGNKALELVSSLTERDLLICLISGGGSALMTSPHPKIGLENMQALTKALLSCGARIDEINTLRRHLDQVKGGRIAESAVPAKVAGLILSDVVGNSLEAIASGPTAPDPSTKADALNILKKYQLAEKIPTSIVTYLENATETPKPNAPLFSRVQNVLIGSNYLAAQAGLEEAKSLGFHTKFIGDTWQGEARETAGKLCTFLQEDFPRPFCMIAGGETTVTLRGNGCGGRNQELALAAAHELDGLHDAMLITLATDGEDGPTDAAGAVVTDRTLQRANTLGLHYESFLANNDSYAFFKRLDDLIDTGPTGTNVNDLTFLFGF